MRKQMLSQHVALLATIVLMIASGVAPAAADNILFYNSGTGVAVVGEVSPNGAYRDLKTHAFDRGWSHIVCASNGTLLAYNSLTGLTATGRFAADGGFTDLKSFNLDKGWSDIIPLSAGKLLFSNLKGKATTGLLSTDGSYHDLGDLDFASLRMFVETRNGTLLSYHLEPDYPGAIKVFGIAAIGRILPDGSYVNQWAEAERWPEAHRITTIFGEGFLLHELGPGKNYLARLNASTRTASISPVAGMEGFYYFVTMNNTDMLLLYNSYTGKMATGNIVPTTATSLRFIPLQERLLDPGWSQPVMLR